MSERRSAVLCDVDGTLSLCGDRDPYDWKSSGRDTASEMVVLVVQCLRDAGLEVVYISGRVEDARAITQEWLDMHVGIPGPLFLRRSGDRRSDSIVKREIFEERIAPIYDAKLVLDDRDRVVQMWRTDLGLVCFQVAPGDF